MGCEPPARAGGRGDGGDGMSECSNVTEGTAEAPSWGRDGESLSAIVCHVGTAAGCSTWLPPDLKAMEARSKRSR